MRVLVTGGVGFIGSHLVDRFVERGYAVRVLDNLDPKVHPKRSPSSLPKSVEFIQGNITDPETLTQALRGIDIVSHQAAYQDYLPDFSRYMQVNVVGTALLYEIIVRERLPIKKVIVASSQATYGEGQYTCPEHGFFLAGPRTVEQLTRARWEVGCARCGKASQPCLLVEEHTNPVNQYAVSKLAEEKTALGLGWLYEIPTVALRYSITQGPRQSLFNHYSGICRIFVTRGLRQEPLIVYEDGRQTRDFIHIDDVVDANMLVLEKDEANFQAFNVGSGKSTSVLEYAAAVQKKLPGSVEILIAGEYRRGDNRNSVSCVEKLGMLGWRPRRTLDRILDDFIGWIESIGGIPDQVTDAYRDMKHAGVVIRAATTQ